MNESQEQIKVANYLEEQNIKYSSIPSSFFTGKKNFGMINKLKKEGWKSGVPDLIAIIPFREGGNRLIFIEMKKAKTIGKRGGLIGGGIISKEQKEWIEAINTCKEVEAFICYGADKAIKLIKSLI